MQENWIFKQHDRIEDLNQKVSRMVENGVIIKESSESKSLRKKVLGIEIDVDNLKKKTTQRIRSQSIQKYM